MPKYRVTVEQRISDLLRGAIEVDAPNKRAAIKLAKNACELEFFAQIWAHKPIATLVEALDADGNRVETHEAGV